MSKRLSACVLVAALLATSAPAPARAAGPTSFSLTGRGYGHGRGMGQWGAKAIAARGRSWKTILGYYYYGVRYATLPSDSPIRVHVGTLSSTMVTSSSPFNVYEIGGRTIATGTSGAIRVRPTSTGMIVERGPRYSGPWTRLRSTTRNIGFTPGRSMLQVLETDGGFRAFRSGTIAVRRVSAGTVWVIVTTRIETYLRGVVPREMPSSWPAHALRAQSVAARTYAVRAMRRSRARGLAYDICSSTACQVFGGARRRTHAGAPVQILETDRTDNAILMTRRVIMTYAGEPILAEFSSSTGGYTAPGGTAYLRARPDPSDSISPHHTWTTTISASLLEKAYPAIGDLERIVVTDRNGYGTGGGRVVTVRLEGSTGDIRIKGSAFRFAAKIRSDWFFVRA